MRSMTWSRFPRRGLPEAPLPLQIKATNWPPANEINASNNDLVVAITEVIAENTIPSGNHQISPKKLLEPNPKQLDTKLQEDRSSLLLIP